MPLDALFLGALVSELEPELVGSRIDKVHMPERDLFLFTLRKNRLLVSLGSGARVSLLPSEGLDRYENPQSPPSFCMLLRKHCAGARIVSIEQPVGERVLIIGLETTDELGVFSERRLIIELIGRAANLILADGDGLIIDCLRRVPMDERGSRPVLPRLPYELPQPQEHKRFLLAVSSEERAKLWAEDSGNAEPARWLERHFSGLSPLICRELEARALAAADAATIAVTLPREIDALEQLILQGNCQPTMLRREGEPFDFCFMPISQYGGAVSSESFASHSALLEAFYSQRERADHDRRRSQSLLRTVKTLRDRTQRRIGRQEMELQKTSGQELPRRFGDIITANIYRIKRGDAILIAEDYYEEDSPEVRIPLDIRLTPQQNAARYYKQYSKLRNAEGYLSRQLEAGRQQLNYLESVLSEIASAETEAELDEIRYELTIAGFIRESRNTSSKSSKTKKGAKGVHGKKRMMTPPRRFVTEAGLEILVGRSNLQNEELTFRMADKNDIWLHVKDYHGSHVILRCPGGAEPDEGSLEQAAALAVQYSEAREGGRVAVDYTLVRNVKKIPNGFPGLVSYTGQRTCSPQRNKSF